MEKCKTCGINERMLKVRLCRDCHNALKKARRELIGSRDWFKRKFHSLRQRAKTYKRVFTLSFDEFVELYKESTCAYCEQIIIKKSVDRIDNSKGYVSNNCVAVCFECNVLKNKLSVLQIKNIYNLISR